MRAAHREPTTIYVAAGHMHLLGASIKLELNPGTPRAKVLLDIPRWDFHWQNAYTLARPGPTPSPATSCASPAGTTSRNARTAATASPSTPRYVLWGEGTTDEMCLGILQVTRG